jgi:hypothetical protein
MLTPGDKALDFVGRDQNGKPERGDRDAERQEAHDPGEAGMLTGVFHLHEQEARQVMTPAPAVVTALGALYLVAQKMETSIFAMNTASMLLSSRTLRRSFTKAGFAAPFSVTIPNPKPNLSSPNSISPIWLEVIIRIDDRLNILFPS